MSEQRFTIESGLIIDTDNADCLCSIQDTEIIVNTLNSWDKLIGEQQNTINKLDQENADLLGARIKAQEEWEKCTDKLKAKILEQQTIIQSLKLENDKLKGLIKENVFVRYVEGSLADLEFKAIAYDDIVKLEMSNETEPKVIVVCKQGKKENVKRFCQMFIPFGVYYEIKEIIE